MNAQPVSSQSMARRLLKLVNASMITPRGLLVRVAILTTAFLVCHGLGLREYTTLLSGTSPDGQPITFESLLLGGLYLFSWFGFVLIVPILLIATGVLRVLRRAFPD